MNFATATRSRRHDVAMIFLKHPHLFTFGVCLLVFYGCHRYCCSSDQYPAKSSKLFASFGRVLEITDGSLEFLSNQLQSSSFKFVLFYAPWCAQSKRAAVGFNKAANLLKDEVKFIAINCWIGTCRQDHVLDSFPKMFAYHSGFNGVQYMGDYDPRQMVRFIHSVIKPIIYVGRIDDFVKLKSGAKGFVVSYFNSTALDSKNYSVYFSVALQSVGKASSPLFTVVTNQVLAEKVGISSSGGIVNHRIQNPPVVYPSSANYTKAAILHWIERNSEELVVQLSASVTGRDHLARQLKRGPALILFLPLEQQKISQPLMDVYTHAAQQFYNCSCHVPLHAAPFAKSGDVEQTDTDTLEAIEQERPEKREKVKKPASQEAPASEGEKGSLFVAALDVQRYCQSVSLHDGKRNVCDVCNTCRKLQGCTHLTDLKINQDELQKQFPVNAVVAGKNCISLRNSYNPGVTINACCVELTQKQAKAVSSEKSARKTEKGAFQSIMDFDVADVNGIIDQWIKRFTTLFQASSKGEGLKLWDVNAQIDGDRVLISARRGISPDGTAGQDDAKMSTGDQTSAESLKKDEEREGLDKKAAKDSSPDGTASQDDAKTSTGYQTSAESLEKDEEREGLDKKTTETPKSVENPNVVDTPHQNGSFSRNDSELSSGGLNSSCPQAGQVAEFRGAGCLSNRSLNFFYMDSSQHWVVAERLGLITDESRVKTGLVIVDLKNEAQFVLDEALEITNESVVEFMMNYMSGSLHRRFTSSHHVVSTCSSPHACVVEVTTATFDATVLDNNKDVLLLYYAPWCGYCVGLSPVYLTVARFFENITRVRIARINADENDLSYEFVVTHYPTFILYPAGRKDFSVRFPDVRERTAQNLIQFVLDHASERTRRTIYGHDDDDLCSKSNSYWTKIRELEARLQATEEERAFLEARLRDALKVKKEVREAEFGSAKEKQFLLRIKQAEDTSFKAIAASTLFSKELELMRDKLQVKEKQLDELLLEKSKWSRNVRVKDLDLERAERENDDLRKRTRALLRRLRQLEIARKVATRRTAQCRSKKAGQCHDRTSSHQEHGERLSRERSKSDHKQTTESEQRHSEVTYFPESVDGFRESIPTKPPNE